jgi:hypothetical protein
MGNLNPEHLRQGRRVSHILTRLYKEDRPSFQVRFIQPQVLSYPGPRESLLEDRNFKSNTQPIPRVARAHIS